MDPLLRDMSPMWVLMVMTSHCDIYYPSKHCTPFLSYDLQHCMRVL